MNQTNIIKSSIITTLLASLALLSGCAADAGDDSDDAGIAELAGTWGGPGQPALPKAMTPEPGDDLEYYRETCELEPATRAKDANACIRVLYGECKLDGGSGSGENTVIGHTGCDCVARCEANPGHVSCQPGGACVGAKCQAVTIVSCLFKADAS